MTSASHHKVNIRQRDRRVARSVRQTDGRSSDSRPRCPLKMTAKSLPCNLTNNVALLIFPLSLRWWMGSGCDSPGGGQRSDRSLGSLLRHFNGSWNMSPKRPRTPRRLGADDELTATRNYRWSVLKTHKVSPRSPHLHTSVCKWLIIDINFFFFCLFHHITHTHTSLRMLMIDCGLRWRWHHHCFYLFGRSQQLLASRRLISDCFLNAFWRLMWKCNQAQNSMNPY